MANIAKAIASEMPGILAEIPSSRNPGKSYKIVRGKDGVVYCNCWQWKKTRWCKHLEEWSRMKQQPAHGDIQAIIDQVVAELKGAH